MSSRFVILHHLLDDGQHWDLMLEHQDVLLTWQLPCEPVDRSILPIPTRRIGDHRKAYLDFEGPISGNRGRVRRVDTGALDIQELTATRCVFELRGRRLTGRFALSRRGDDSWLFLAG